MKRKNRLFLGLCALAVFFCVFTYAKAGVSENTRGWLWGGSDDGGGNATGLGWISTNNISGGSSVSYGISVPSGDGPVTGYGWSENIGWIDFQPRDDGSMPSGCGAVSRVGNTLTGCARIMGIAQEKVSNNSGGWDGWVKMSGSTYGVTIAETELGGYAWSSELGWIDFSKATINVTTGNYLIVCSGTTDSVTILKNTTKQFEARYFENFVGVPDCSLLTGFTDVTSPPTTWSSDNANIPVSSVGVVFGNAVGTSKITATYNGLSGTGNVTVTENSCSCDALRSKDVCKGTDYEDSCGQKTCHGAKDCRNSSWKEVAP